MDDIVQQTRREAKYYAEIGWQVVPCHSVNDGVCTCRKPVCKSPGKHPRLTAWQKQATTDGDTIDTWLDQWPDSNIGVRLGPTSDLIDIEYDSEEGEATAKELLGDIKTPRFKSSRSVHHLFAFPAGLEIPKAVVTWRGLEIRFGTDGKGAQSIFPPSRHASGKRYEWVDHPSQTGIADAPSWLADALRGDPQPTAGDPMEFTWRDTSETLEDHPGESSGGRNKKLAELVGRYIAMNGVNDKVVGLALAWGGRCTPAMDQDEILSVVSNIVGREHEKGIPDQQAAASVKQSFTVRRYADIPKEEVMWLWQDRIPLGKYTIFAGEPGIGKTFAAMDVAAKVTTGGTFADGAVAPLGDVLIISSEDGPGDTLKPRLEAAGADMSRCLHLDGVEVSKGDSFLDLAKHTPQIETYFADNPELLLMIMDPLTAFLGDIDTHKEGPVRRVLGPISELLMKYRVAMLGIGHCNKAVQAKAINRVVGSIGFVAAARVAWQFARDPDNDDKVLMLTAKNNLSQKKSGLSYSVVDSRCVWDADDVPMSADDIDTESQTPRDEAKRWLAELLASGDVPAETVLKKARADGVAERTLYRAKKELGVTSGRAGEQWTWRLPGTPEMAAGEWIVQ